MAKSNESTAVATQTATAGNGGLAVYESSNFLALQPDNDIVEAMECNMLPGEGFDEQNLVRVKIPAGGATTWAYEVMGQEVSSKEIKGLIVAYCQRGILWPTAEVGTSRPYLTSHDLRFGVKTGDDIGDLDPKIIDAMLIKEGPNAGKYDWRGTEEGGPNKYNDWGSSTKGSGKGKRCVEKRVLFILTEGNAFPFVVEASPGSLMAVKRFTSTLPAPHFRVVVSLQLEKDNNGKNDYSKIKPVFVGVISKEEGKAIRRLYTDPLAITTQKMDFTDLGNDDGLGS